jgi:predicted Zn-dependent peptidase
MLSGLIYAKDDPNEAAQVVGMLATAGMSDDEIENYADNIEKVTLDDVKNAFNEMMNSTQVEAVVEPEGVKK